MTYTKILDVHVNREPTSANDVDRLARVFILCLIGSTLCASRTNTVSLYYLPFFKNFDEIWTFNWGGARLSCLYRNMNSLSRGKSRSIGGFWWAWEVCMSNWLSYTSFLSIQNNLPKVLMRKITSFFLLKLIVMGMWVLDTVSSLSAIAWPKHMVSRDALVWSTGYPGIPT